MEQSQKWISFTEAKITEELYNQMHNDYINKHGCGKQNCVICNSLKKETKQENENKRTS